MDKVDVSVSLPKESYELASGLVQLVKDLASSSGSPMERLPELVAAVIKFLPALDGYQKIAQEAKDAPLGVVKALAVVLPDQL